MVRIYTVDACAPLDSATITPQIYPEGKLVVLRAGIRNPAAGY